MSLVLGALVMIAAPAAAGTLPGPPAAKHTGKVGPFSLVDTQDSPGGRCAYGKIVDGHYVNYLDTLRVKAPQVKARSGRTSQRVGWRLVVQAWSYEANRWRSYRESDWSFALTSHSAVAPLPAKSLRISSWKDNETYGAWRGKVEIRWYAKDGTTIVGTAATWAHVYRAVEGESEPYNWTTPHCGSTTG